MESREYTSIQKFFWWLSGSEIHVLKNCKTDYNRHATTGAILLVTAVVAFAAGSYAGWYFSYDNKTGHHNMISALGFGLLWGCLIYTIDRMMVVSIKKDPSVPKEKQPFWSILIPRTVIGIMIAFFISIPVELLVFKEEIDKQMLIDNRAAVVQAVKDENFINNTDGRTILIVGDSVKAARLREQENGPCLDPEFEILTASETECNRIATNLKRDYDNLSQRYDAMISNNPFRADNNERIRYPDDERVKEARNEARRRWLRQNSECSQITRNKGNVRSAYYSRIRRERTESESSYQNKRDSLSDDVIKIARNADNLANNLNSMNGFSTKAKALESAAWAKGGGAVLFLLWLIRFVFIGIEILPTYNKLTTPIGDYDRAINASEKIFSNHLIGEIELQKDLEYERRQNEKSTLAGSEKERIDQEAALNKRVLVKVAAAQERVALDALKKWEEKEIGTATVNGSAN